MMNNRKIKKEGDMKVFVYAAAVALICYLLGVVFLILARGAKGRERFDTCKNLSRIFFCIAIGVTISTTTIFLMVSYHEDSLI